MAQQSSMEPSFSILSRDYRPFPEEIQHGLFYY